MLDRSSPATFTCWIRVVSRLYGMARRSVFTPPEATNLPAKSSRLSRRMGRQRPITAFRSRLRRGKQTETERRDRDRRGELPHLPYSVSVSLRGFDMSAMYMRPAEWLTIAQ